MAFDRLRHEALFQILKQKGICPLISMLLFNMYTHSTMKVRWNNAYSESFPLQNCVKQGNCLSPILFTIYIDGLLERLKNAAIGCHIGRVYAGAFGYADDLALIAPSLHSLKRMILICERYAEEFSIMFNPSKSKLLCYNMLTNAVPSIMLCGEVVEVVQFEKHLGNKL